MRLRTLTTTLTLCAAATAQAATFDFGLWGDMPYAKNHDAARTQAVIDSINASPIAFSIYDGDIKDGSSKCTDDVFDRAKAMFNGMKAPVVYVPGDNEWTDCHRTNNGGYDNLERLAHLRRVMFADSRSFGQRRMDLSLQAAPGQPYAENTRFVHEGVVFAGFNMPGSNNNFVKSAKSCSKKSARTPEQCEADNAEYATRNQANLSWLASTFAQARQQQAKGVVVVFQADPGFDLPETEDTDESKSDDFKGYQDFMAALVKHTEGFAGQVLVVHGDTHFFKMDKPLYGPLNTLTNLTRVQTFGSPNNHWVRVTVDTQTPEVFTVRPVMVKAK